MTFMYPVQKEILFVDVSYVERRLVAVQCADRVCMYIPVFIHYVSLA